MAEQKECFIIMPITTPEKKIKEYRDGAAHFKHVLDCLFIPAIEKAGYIPKPPISKGSDLIHAEIISSLETADIVLCDMSCLNPNVFFEFGIRTALNKSVSVVKDELTKTVPFDTGIINYQEYNSSLEPWLLDKEINKLSEHINTSFSRSNGENGLWKYFGLKSEVIPYKPEAGTEGKLDYLTFQIDSLREKIDKLTPEDKTLDSSLGNSNYRNQDKYRYSPESEVWSAVIKRIDAEDHLLACKLDEARALEFTANEFVIGYTPGMSILADSIKLNSSSIEAILKELTGRKLKLNIMTLPK
jgi:hypothetical protein